MKISRVRVRFSPAKLPGSQEITIFVRYLAGCTEGRQTLRRRPASTIGFIEEIDAYRRRKECRFGGAYYPHQYRRADEVGLHRLLDVGHRLAGPARRARRSETRTPTHPLRYERGAQPLLRQTHP